MKPCRSLFLPTWLHNPRGALVALVALFGLAPSLAFAQDEAASASEQEGETLARLQELFARAAEQEQDNLWDEAESSLREALEIAPESAEAHRRIGKFLYWGGAQSEGLSLLYRAANLQPADISIGSDLIDALVDERDYYFNNGDVSSAESALARARQTVELLSKTHLDDREVLRRLARVMWRNPGEEERGLDLIERLLKQWVDEPTLHRDYVQAVGAASAFERALLLYEELEMAYWLKTWFQAEVHVLRAHYNYNRYLEDDQAIADYRAANILVLESARLNEDYFEAASENAAFYRAWAGWTFLRTERLAEARVEFIHSLGRHPDNVSAREGLSHIGAKLNEAGDLAKARDFYRVACLWAPDRADFWNNYGLLCRDTGEYEESFAAYRRALALAPDDPRIINDCALILQYHLDRDIDLAERWLLRAREIAERNWIDALDGVTRAEALLVYGDTLVNLARLFAGQGRMLESAEAWNTLRDVDPTREDLDPGSAASTAPAGEGG